MTFTRIALLATAAFSLASTPALADHHGGGAQLRPGRACTHGRGCERRGVFLLGDHGEAFFNADNNYEVRSSDFAEGGPDKLYGGAGLDLLVGSYDNDIIRASTDEFGLEMDFMAGDHIVAIRDEDKNILKVGDIKIYVKDEIKYRLLRLILI